MKGSYLNMLLPFNAIIEVYTFPVWQNQEIVGYVCHYVNRPVPNVGRGDDWSAILNKLADGPPVARFVVRYKRTQNMKDDLERLRYKNYLFISKKFYLHGYRPDL